MKFQIKTFHGFISPQPPDEHGNVVWQYRAAAGEYEQMEGIGWDFQQPPPTPAPGPDPGPEPPPVNPDADPYAIIQAVYATGQYQLLTKEGCGRFTEACCTALHQQHSPMWGHVRKEPGQNQWNGHATDAIHLLARAGSTDPGIYDIIRESESTNAAPVFNYADPPDPDLWYYPASTNARAVTQLYDITGQLMASPEEWPRLIDDLVAVIKTL